MLESVNWRHVFLPDTPVAEIAVRGAVTYLVLFLLMRFVLKRQSGAVSISDLLVLVLIADAAQNGMSDDYRSVSDGIVLVGVIIFSSYALDWLGYHFRFLERLVYPGPLPLVKEGKMLLENMRSELITRYELMSQLRSQGVERLEDVHLAMIEGDGSISVIRRDGEKPEKPGKAAERVV